jgi:hypothetical protein
MIYWYDQNTILRIQSQHELIINTLQTDVHTTITSAQEYLSRGFKFYAYSYAFLISAIISALGMIFFKTSYANITRVHGISRPLLIFAILLLLLIVLSFASTVITKGLGRYLLGQGIIFILSLIIVSNIIATILTNISNRKYIYTMLVMLFTYHISGLTQPYWSPDITFNTYSTDINYSNVQAIYSKINENDIVYLTSNIPVKYDLHYTEDYLIKLYKLKPEYNSLNKRFIEGEPIFYKITNPSQSVINFLSNEKVSITIENSNKFNKVFMSNRYSTFYTTPLMTRQ